MATIREMLNRNSATRFAAPAALGAVAVFALGACGGSSPAASGSAAQTPAAPASSAHSGSPSQEMHATVTLDDAGATAVRKVPGGTLVSIELEQRDAVWETQVVAKDGTEHEINVRTSGGSVASSHVKRESAAKRSEHQRRVKAAKLDYRDAAEKARAAVHGGKITELNLDDYRGTTVWESDVRAANTKHEVKVDAATGKILVNHTASGDDD